jgi:hypothetical protein
LLFGICQKYFWKSILAIAFFPPQCVLIVETSIIGRHIMANDLNVLALVKDSERYIFLYDDESREETLRTLGRFASNAELSFTWYDAAVLSQRVRQANQMDAPAPQFDLPVADDGDGQCCTSSCNQSF